MNGGKNINPFVYAKMKFLVDLRDKNYSSFLKDFLKSWSCIEKEEADM